MRRFFCWPGAIGVLALGLMLCAAVSANARLEPAQVQAIQRQQQAPEIAATDIGGIVVNVPMVLAAGVVVLACAWKVGRELASVETRLAVTDSRFAATELRLASATESVERVSARFDAMERLVRDLSAEVASQRASQDQRHIDNQRRLASIEGDVKHG